jgi:hypothetical protein
MQLFSWLGPRTIGRLPNPRGRKHGLTPRPQFHLEALEERYLLSTLTVLNTNDSGAGSLRDAINTANIDNNGDQVTFDHSLSGQTIKLTSGVLEISANLDIKGLGAAHLAVSGNNASQVFLIDGGATVSIADLTITHGATSGIGGGIFNQSGAVLTLSHVAVTDNTVTAFYTGSGGGLFNEGTAVVVSSTFKDNQVLGDKFGGTSEGGAIGNANGGTLTVTNSDFVHNRALGAGAGFFGKGGAIENIREALYLDPPTATITNCVFRDNQGGGSAWPATAALWTTRGYGRP